MGNSTQNTHLKKYHNMTMEETREQLAIDNKKRDSALKCIQKKKLKQYLKDNNINTTIEDLSDEQLAEFNSSQNKKGPKYDMNNECQSCDAHENRRMLI